MESFPHPVVTIGLDEDWPSSIISQTYFATTSCISPSEDILVTGGGREGLAVYSVWDMKTTDGKTFIHPCKTRYCVVCHVSFHHSRGHVELRTGCVCGRLCRWDISSDSHSLLEQILLGSKGSYWWWAHDGSKVVRRIEVDEPLEMDGDKPVMSKGGALYHLSISGTPPICHSLLKGTLDTKWWFSPGHGDKVVGADREKLTLWTCSSGLQIFQKSHAFGDFPHHCFSPDGTMIVCSGSGGAKLISAEDGTVLRSWNGSGEVYGIQFFPKGDRFIATGFAGICLFDGDVLHEKKIECGSVFISPDGQRVATISYDGADIFNHNLD
jgi:WD40 repeat protein